MKAARLVSEIVILSARTRPITAAQLAARLEVTVRTVYRDLAELSRMGVPVVAESGPGGGIGLMGGWTSPLSGLTRDEVDSVLIGSLAATDLGLSKELATARSKIAAESETIVADRILVDGPDWFVTKEQPQWLVTIVEALRGRRGVRLDYAGPHGRRSRTLIPLGLVIKAGRWYFVGQPPGGRPRTYRVSRIAGARLRYASATPPPGFGLVEYWERAQLEFDRAIRAQTVRLRLPVSSLDDLRRVIPGRLTDDAITAGHPADDALEIDLPMEPVAIAVAQLLGVPGVKVVSPRSLREAVAGRAHELARLNGPEPAL
ncbi:WYL domain-containing protein [Brevibacterium sp.]|uniref:helix-turn-helix transcriptional regulator n=1 Tax=Brevibacterium sp. TaxID=1701 RepID=UPI0028119E60|nr:WYL domain-containing protein [Brevibacterium sp.]